MLQSLLLFSGFLTLYFITIFFILKCYNYDKDFYNIDDSDDEIDTNYIYKSYRYNFWPIAD